ncbi:MAG: hypothetical protein HZA54_15395 [Planctomycetes bacterium]|nr:hypothetical protein [Planctomycetota bacterium]
MDLNDRIQCRICGRFFGSLVKHLVCKHRIPLTQWTRARVLEAIRAEHAAGRSLAITEVRRRFPGAWHAALTHAGLDPQAYLKQEQWSQARVIEELQKHAREGFLLRWTRTRTAYPNLAKVARTWFGSWDVALQAAGVEVSTAGVSWGWPDPRNEACRPESAFCGPPVKAELRTGGHLRAAFLGLATLLARSRFAL